MVKKRENEILIRIFMRVSIFLFDLSDCKRGKSAQLKRAVHRQRRHFALKSISA